MTFQEQDEFIHILINLAVLNFVTVHLIASLFL